MKTILLYCLLSLVSFGGISQKALFVNQPKDSVVHLDPRMQPMDFVPGQILIRYSDDAEVQNLKAGEIVQTGMVTIDSIFTKYKINTQEKLFPAEQKLKSKVMLRSFNGTEFEQPSLHNIYKLSLPQESNLFEAIEELKHDPKVIYAEPNYNMSVTNDKAVSPPMTERELMQWSNVNLEAIPNSSPVSSSIAGCPIPMPGNPPDPKSAPNDPLFPQQWYIPAVHADEVWDTVQGKDSTQVICILDTGVDWMHPDLENKIWTNPGEIPGNGIDDDGNGYVDDVRGWDWINNDNNPMDDNSHGTHVAGIAAAEANNGIGISGVSHGAKIMALKVFQSSGRGDAATISQGINYAKNMGATAINMSFGSYARSMTMETALANAYASCALVAASGNDGICIGPGGTCKPMFPAALSYVLGTQANASWSNFDQDGPVYSMYPDLWNYEMKAPGTEILSTIPDGNYRVYQGTSMAAPVLSGSLAIYRSLFPGQSQELMWAKLIQTSSTYFNIHSAITCIPAPKLWFVSNTVVDSIQSDDNDGRVDAGETIQLWFKMRNTGGQADSVQVGIRFAEFEDTTTAQIITRHAYIGSISPYATLTNQWIPLKIHIDPDVVNDRDIVFQAYCWSKNSSDTVFQNVTLNIENGEELQGVLGDTLILTPDKLWLVNGSFKIAPTGVLIISAGTTLKMSSKIVNDGTIIGNGKPDSTFSITANCSLRCITGSGSLKLNFGKLSFTTYNNDGCCVSYQRGFINNSTLLQNSQIGIYNGGDFSFENCRFINSFCIGGLISGNQTVITKNCLFDNCNYNLPWTNPPVFNNWKYSSSLTSYNRSAFLTCSNYSFYRKCIFLNSYHSISIKSEPGYYVSMANQYLGTIDSVKIEKKIFDFFDDASLAQIIYQPLLTQPSDSAHGIVWKILVNNKDAQDEVPDPIGIGPQKFDVYFNKPMDPAHTPEVSFGVRAPYNQTAVNDSGRWSPDHMIYTCYKTVQLFTGDGINRLRVAGAKDLDGWEIPVEDERFEFVIQAAGSSSLEFTAQAGIGKVNLEWNNAGIPDLLGFNMYRFENITDTTYTRPVIINKSLITDTTYTDFTVTPGKHYWYYYKVVNTDFKEADSSKFVSAVPYNATLGDANGDESVNVLDITSVIAYMLGQNPQPFLFDAADVNNDHSINILDVIGIVNRIIHPTKSGYSITGTNPVPAHIRLDSDRIVFTSDGQVSSLQFELAGEGLDKIHLASPPAGFELAYGLVNGKLLGILYSSANRTIPAGTIDLVKITDATATPEWGAILAGDGSGNIVPVLKEGAAGASTPEMFLQAYPNPFSQKVTFNFRLLGDAHVKLSVYSMTGRLIHVLADKEMKEGLQWVEWNGTNFSNRPVPSGIYLCKLEGINSGGDQFHKETKIIFIK